MIRLAVLLVLLVNATVSQAQKHLEFLRPDRPTPITFKQLQDSMRQYFNGKYQGKGSGYKIWKRYEEWMKYHQNPDGTLGNLSGRSFDAIKELGTINQQAADGPNSVNINTGSWSSVGPVYNQGVSTGIGRTNCIAFHPTNANIVYVGAPIGGIWRGDKTSGSFVWTPLSDGIATLGVSSIVLHPNDPNIIYILTGDGNRGDCLSTGILVSYNAGYSWQETGLKPVREDGWRGYKMLINPLRPATMYATFNVGVYRTYDGGTNWTKINALPGCYDIEFCPGDTTVMYACGFATLYTLTGGTWSNKSGYLPAGTRRVAIAVTPADNLKVYVYCGRHDSLFISGAWVPSFKGVLRSDNQGNTYTTVCNRPNISGYNQDGSSMDNEQSDIDMDIAVSPTNSAIVYAGTENVWKSTNSGASFGSSAVSYWSTASNFYIHEDINFLAFSPVDGSVYCGSDGGVYRSTNGGTVWVDMGYGLVISQFYRIAVQQANVNIIVNGSQDAAGNVRVGATSEYKELNGGDGTDCMIDEQDDKVLYTSYPKGVLYRTLNGAAPSIPINGGLTGNWITPLAMDRYKSDTIYYGQVAYSSAGGVLSDNVWRSFNKGTNWTNIGGGGSDALAIGINNTGRLYGYSAGTMMTTANANAAGPTWVNAMGPNYPSAATLSNAPVSKITVNPTDDEEVWFCMGGYDAGNKVFRSVDAGANWQNMSAGLPNVAILSIVYGSNLGIFAGGVYVGTDIGVFYRNDALGTWIPFRNWMPAVPVWDLKINYSHSLIRAGTYGRGIWESPLYSGCVSDINLTNFLEGYHYYQATNSITAQAVVEFGNGNTVNLKAGNYIDLKPGFNAGNGSFFRAYQGPCGSGIPPAADPAGDEKAPQKNGADTIPPIKKLIRPDVKDIQNPLQLPSTSNKIPKVEIKQ